LGCFRQIRWANQGSPDFQVEVAHLGIGQRRDLAGQRTATAGQANRLELASPDLRQCDTGRHQRHLDLTAQHGGHDLRVALVGHMHGSEVSSRGLEQLHTEVSDRAVTDRAIVPLVAAIACGQKKCAAGWLIHRRNQYQGCGGQQRDRGEVFGRVVRQLGI